MTTVSDANNCSHGRLVNTRGKREGKKLIIKPWSHPDPSHMKPAAFQGAPGYWTRLWFHSVFILECCTSKANSGVHCAGVRQEVKQILSWWTISLRESLSWIVMETRALGLLPDTFISLSSTMAGRLWKRISWDGRFYVSLLGGRVGICAMIYGDFISASGVLSSRSSIIWLSFLRMAT